MLNHLTLSYLYLAVLAITPSYLLSKAFRFALMPAFQIYLDNDAQARYWIKICTTAVFAVSALLLLVVFE